MARQTLQPRRLAGIGWLIGMTLGLSLGAVGWWMTNEVTILIVLFVATGSALGYTIENLLNPTSTSPGRRRLVLVLLTLGAAAGVAVFLYVSIVG